MREDQRRLLGHLREGEFEAARVFLKGVRKREPRRELLPSHIVGPLFGEAFSRGQLEDALAITEIWALASPLRVGPLFSMARVHAARGDRKARRSCLDRVIALDPQSSDATRAREALADN